MAGTVIFHALGDGALAPPPRDPGAWTAWAEGRDPLVATVAVLRLVVLALCWYLVGATSVGIVARLSRAARLVRVADALTVPALRRLLQGALGVSLATAMVAAAVPPSAFTTVEAATITLRASDGGSRSLDVGPASGPGAALGADPGADARADPGVLVRLAVADEVSDPDVSEAEVPGPGNAVSARDAGDVEAAGTGNAVSGRGPDVRPLPLALLDRSASAPTPGSASARASVDRERGPDLATDTREHVVVGGDSLWSIARDAVREVEGPAPDDARIHAHWRRLIDVNRDRLADPDNPDLIFPGQRLVLPRPDGAGA